MKKPIIAAVAATMSVTSVADISITGDAYVSFANQDVQKFAGLPHLKGIETNEIDPTGGNANHDNQRVRIKVTGSVGDTKTVAVIRNGSETRVDGNPKASDNDRGLHIDQMYITTKVGAVDIKAGDYWSTIGLGARSKDAGQKNAIEASMNVTKDWKVGAHTSNGSAADRSTFISAAGKVGPANITFAHDPNNFTDISASAKFGNYSIAAEQWMDGTDEDGDTTLIHASAEFGGFKFDVAHIKNDKASTTEEITLDGVDVEKNDAIKAALSKYEDDLESAELALLEAQHTSQRATATDSLASTADTVAAKTAAATAVTEAEADRDEIQEIVDALEASNGKDKGVISSFGVDETGKILDTADRVMHEVRDMDSDGNHIVEYTYTHYANSRKGSSIYITKSGGSPGTPHVQAYVGYNEATNLIEIVDTKKSDYNELTIPDFENGESITVGDMVITEFDMFNAVIAGVSAGSPADDGIANLAGTDNLYLSPDPASAIFDNSVAGSTNIAKREYKRAEHLDYIKKTRINGASGKLAPLGSMLIGTGARGGTATAAADVSDFTKILGFSVSTEIAGGTTVKAIYTKNTIGVNGISNDITGTEIIVSHPVGNSAVVTANMGKLDDMDDLAKRALGRITGNGTNTGIRLDVKF